MLAERSLLHTRLARMHAQAAPVDMVAPAGRDSMLHRVAHFFSRPTSFSFTPAAVVIGLLITAMALIAAPIYRHLASPGHEAGEYPPPVIVARLTGAHDAVWTDGQIGTRLGAHLPAGHRMELTAGMAELTFTSGAVVVIEAPAVVQVDGPQQCRIEAGRLIGRVPAGAVGFVVRSPHATIIDLGTEFAVVVDDGLATEVHVIEGSVEVAAPDRAARILTAGQALAVDRSGSRSITALPATAFAQMPPSLESQFAGSSPALIYSRAARSPARADGAYTVGMLFEVGDAPLVVTHLGVQDVDAVAGDPNGEDGRTGFADADGFYAEQLDEEFEGPQVGLWTPDGLKLLASARVKSGDPVLGSWRYAEVHGEPVVLASGERHLLGAFVGAGRKHSIPRGPTHKTC